MKVSRLIELLSKFDPDENVVIPNEAGRGTSYFGLRECLTQADFYGERPMSAYGREKDIPVEITLFLADHYPGSTHNERIHLNKDSDRYDPFYDLEYVRALQYQLDPKPWKYTDPVSGKKTRLAYDSEHANLPGSVWEPRYGFSTYPEHYHG